jgi:hypothetical protein
VALIITFVKSGTNDQNAITGKLSLLDGATVVKQTNAFSGGNGHNPLDDGTYRLRLNIRGDESSNEVNPDGTLKPFYGIQKISDHIPDAQGKVWDGQYEWGTIRARLNPTGNAPDHGDYIHGKKRPKDWTHGCVCDRSEVILTYLWNLASPPKAINVEVSGGRLFDEEALVVKNVARRRTGRAPQRQPRSAVARQAPPAARREGRTRRRHGA